MQIPAKIIATPTPDAGTIATLEIQITTGGNGAGIANQSGFISVECEASLVSALVAGDCTLTITQP